MDKNALNILRGAHMDSADSENDGGMSAGDYQDTDIQVSVAAVIQEWAGTDDLDSNETMADRLNALLAGVADESGDNDGELSDDELELLTIASDYAVTALVELGASEEDALAIINDNDADAAQRVADMVKESASGDNFVNDFVFGGGSDEAVFDAIYKKRIKVIGGKKVVKKVRISGFVKRSSKQKAAMKKAQMRAHSGVAKMKRAKSMRKRASLGIK